MMNLTGLESEGSVNQATGNVVQRDGFFHVNACNDALTLSPEQHPEQDAPDEAASPGALRARLKHRTTEAPKKPDDEDKVSVERERKR